MVVGNEVVAPRLHGRAFARTILLLLVAGSLLMLTANSQFAGPVAFFLLSLLLAIGLWFAGRACLARWRGVAAVGVSEINS